MSNMNNINTMTYTQFIGTVLEFLADMGYGNTPAVFKETHLVLWGEALKDIDRQQILHFIIHDLTNDNIFDFFPTPARLRELVIKKIKEEKYNQFLALEEANRTHDNINTIDLTDWKQRKQQNGEPIFGEINLCNF